MSRTLIVYCSMTGSCRRVAELLKSLTPWPSAEVLDVEAKGCVQPASSARHAADLRPSESPRYAWCGPDPHQFDRLVVVTPAWLGQLASPMANLLRDVFRHPRQPRSIAVSLVCVIGMDGALAATQEVAAITGGAPSPIVLIRHDDVLDGSCLGELRALTEKIAVLDAASVRQLELG